MYKAVTRGISVTVTPRYVPEESSPDRRPLLLRLRGRDHQPRPRARAAARPLLEDHRRARPVQEVRGAGVVGKQPVLGPGESFNYTSGCPLTTPDGTMQGRYGMVTAAGDTFDVEIPAFSLDSPQARRVVH